MGFHIPWWARAWLFLVCWPAAVLAQPTLLHVYDRDDTVIHLLDAPCTDLVSVSLIREDARGRFKALTSSFGHRDGSRGTYAGCWTELSKQETQSDDEAFLMVFEDRTHFAVLKAEFKKGKGQSGI